MVCLFGEKKLFSLKEKLDLCILKFKTTFLMAGISEDEFSSCLDSIIKHWKPETVPCVLTHISTLFRMPA